MGAITRCQISITTNTKFKRLPLSGKDISDLHTCKEISKSAGRDFALNTSTNSPFCQLDTVNNMEAKFLSAVIILITFLFADGKEGEGVFLSGLALSV